MTGRRTRLGFTLTEALFASAVFAIVALVLFRGLAVAARAVGDQSRYLQADGCAFDLAWRLNGTAFDVLERQIGGWRYPPADELLGTNSATIFTPAYSVDYPATTGGGTDRDSLLLTVRVEWGPTDDRRARWLRAVKSRAERIWK